MEQNTRTRLDTHALGRLVFLGLFSVALASFFPLLAPFPLVLSFLFSGRTAGLYISLASFVILVAIAYFTKFPLVLAATYLVVVLFGFVISEIFFRNIEPMRGIKYAGWIVVTLVLLIVGITFLSAGSAFFSTMKANLVAGIEYMIHQNSTVFDNGGQDAEAIKGLLNNPESMAKEILFWSPAAIFVIIFISIWASVLMILRNSIIWKKYVNYHYSGQNVLKYKTPEYLVYVLIASLVLMLGGEYVIGEVAYYIGGNLLYCLSVFYFFQGFGIYLDVLAFARIRGILRTMLVAFTIIMAWKLLVLIGVFDLWFDFRKLIRKKRKNEGDIL